MVLRSLLASALAGVLLAGGLTLFAPAPAAVACSCARGTPAAYVDWADVVFVGTLTGPPTDEAQGQVIGSTDPLGYTFAVDTVLEGEVPATVTVESARYGASCGLEGMAVDTTYLMFAQAGRGDRLSANLCGGSRPATPALVRRLEALTGGSTMPTPDRTPDPTSAGAPVDDADDDLVAVAGPGSSPSVGYVLIGLSVVILAVMAWLLLPRRRPQSR